MTPQEQLAAQILDSFTPVDRVPTPFAEYVAEQIAARPSPTTPTSDPLVEIRAKLDEILALLRGGTPE